MIMPVFATLGCLCSCNTPSQSPSQSCADLGKGPAPTRCQHPLRLPGARPLLSYAGSSSLSARLLIPRRACARTQFLLELRHMVSLGSPDIMPLGVENAGRRVHKTIISPAQAVHELRVALCTKVVAVVVLDCVARCGMHSGRDYDTTYAPSDAPHARQGSS